MSYGTKPTRPWAAPPAASPWSGPTGGARCAVPPSPAVRRPWPARATPGPPLLAGSAAAAKPGGPDGASIAGPPDRSPAHLSAQAAGSRTGVRRRLVRSLSTAAAAGPRPPRGGRRAGGGRHRPGLDALAQRGRRGRALGRGEPRGLRSGGVRRRLGQPGPPPGVPGCRGHGAAGALGGGGDRGRPRRRHGRRHRSRPASRRGPAVRPLPSTSGRGPAPSWPPPCGDPWPPSAPSATAAPTGSTPRGPCRSVETTRWRPN